MLDEKPESASPTEQAFESPPTMEAVTEANPQVAALARAADLDAEVEALGAEIEKTTAQQAALDAEIITLRGQIEAGDVDSVGPEAIPERRRLVEHFDAVRIGLRKRRERAATQGRLAKLSALRAEIETGTGATSAELAKKARAALAAMTTLAEASHRHDQQLDEWRQQLSAFDVPAHDTPAPEPNPDHAGIGWFSSGDSVGIAAGRNRYRRLRPEHVLDTIARAALATAKGHGADLEPDAVKGLTRIHEIVPELNPNARYFVSVGGSVIEYGPDGPSQSEARGLVREIDQNAAIASWWSGKVDQFKEMTA